MSKKNNDAAAIINSIQNTLDHPTLKVKLAADEVEFLETYAANRTDYIASNFMEEEGKTVRRILDRLVFAYVSLYEVKEHEYTSMVNRLLSHNTTFRERKQKIQELGDNTHAGLKDDWTRRDSDRSE